MKLKCLNSCIQCVKTHSRVKLGMKLKMENKDKIMLDLCAGTGAWSQPYADAGYDRRLITWPEFDVRTYQPPPNVYGILAAPPCTDLAGSGARWWAKKDGNTALLIPGGLDIVIACLRIIEQCQPSFWALENPIGRLVHYLGKPRLYFDPCDYGDPYTKRTCLWGTFNIPKKNPVEPFGENPIHFMPPSPKRQELRSITPGGFARAFYEANK